MTSRYKIEGKLLHWVRSFLKGRKQRVVVNSTESEWTEVTSGIPQGSVLGPTLFLIYINDISDTVKSTIRLFADDLKLFDTVDTSLDSKFKMIPTYFPSGVKNGC